MSRDFRPFLADICLSCRRILRYTSGLTYEQFLADDRTYDAVLRHLTIIGEAVKQIPDEARAQHPVIEWRKIARFRDLVIHHYFAIDNLIVWDVMDNNRRDLPSGRRRQAPAPCGCGGRSGRAEPGENARR